MDGRSAWLAKDGKALTDPQIRKHTKIVNGSHRKAQSQDKQIYRGAKKVLILYLTYLWLDHTITISKSGCNDRWLMWSYFYLNNSRLECGTLAVLSSFPAWNIINSHSIVNLKLHLFQNILPATPQGFPLAQRCGWGRQGTCFPTQCVAVVAKKSVVVMAIERE